MEKESKHFRVMDNFVENYNFPQISKIEFTSRCQLKCPGCMNKDLTEKTDIGTSVISEIVVRDYLRNTGYTELMISGESLLHPKFRRFARWIADTGTAVGLSTNLAFNPRQFSDIYLNKLNFMSTITVSIDSFNPLIYEKMRVGARFDHLMKNVRAMDIELPKDTIIYLQLLKTDVSAPWHLDSIERLKAYARNKLSDRCVVRYVDDCFKGFMDKPYQPVDDMCLTPFQAVCIKYNGDVVPCGYCFDSQIKLGNILKNTLDEIWTGPEVMRLRAVHQSQAGLPDWCTKCYRRSNHTFQQRILADIIKHKNNGSIE